MTCGAGFHTHSRNCEHLKDRAAASIERSGRLPYGGAALAAMRQHRCEGDGCGPLSCSGRRRQVPSRPTDSRSPDGLRQRRAGMEASARLLHDSRRPSPLAPLHDSGRSRRPLRTTLPLHTSRSSRIRLVGRCGGAARGASVVCERRGRPSAAVSFALDRTTVWADLATSAARKCLVRPLQRQTPRVPLVYKGDPYDARQWLHR